jgi:hypothetical protein
MPPSEDHCNSLFADPPLAPTRPPGGASLVRRRFSRLGLLGAVVAVALAGAACGDAAGGESGISVAISAPNDGAEVGESFDVHFDASVPLGEPDTGRQHLHLYFDGNTTEGEYAIVYDDAPFTITELGPGEHTIEARVANADHSVTDARDEITVTVGADDGGPDQQPPAASDDAQSDY